MPISRRTLFTAVGAGLLGLAGCAMGDPRVSEPTGSRWSPTPTPTPTQRPEVQLAAQRESELGTRAASIESAAGDRAGFVQAAEAAAQAHVAVLSTAFGPVVPPDPSAPEPADNLAGATPVWAEQLTSTAAEHRAQALLATGHLGLVLASCATFATVLAAAVGSLRMPIGDVEAGEYVPISDTDALAQLVTQLHAARYTYQAALGPFQLSDDRRKPLEAREAALTGLRDVVSEALVDRGVAPPPAEPAYDVPRPSGATAAIALTMGIEERLLPFVGAAVGGVAAGDELRETIVDQLTATAARLVTAGGTLPRWPGMV